MSEKKVQLKDEKSIDGSVTEESFNELFDAVPEEDYNSNFGRDFNGKDSWNFGSYQSKSPLSNKGPTIKTLNDYKEEEIENNRPSSNFQFKAPVKQEKGIEVRPVKRFLKNENTKEILAFIKENQITVEIKNLKPIEEYLILLADKLEFDIPLTFIQDASNLYNKLAGYYHQLHFLYHPKEDFKNGYDAIKSYEQIIPACFKDLHDKWMKELETKL